LVPQRDATQSERYLFSKFRGDDMFAPVAGHVTFVSRTTHAAVCCST
jgi:hypothetical protein